jgi:hypothetical protein
VGVSTTVVRSGVDLNLSTVHDSQAYNVVADLTISDQPLLTFVAVGGAGPALLDLGQPTNEFDANGSITNPFDPTSLTLQSSVSIASWPGIPGPGDYRNCPVVGPDICYLPITFGVPFPATASLLVTMHTSTLLRGSFGTVAEDKIIPIRGIVDTSFRPIPGAQLVAIPETSSIILVVLGLSALTLFDRSKQVA